MSSSICPFCHLEQESVDYLFFRRNYARGVWNQCNRWVVIIIVMHYKVVQHFTQFYGTKQKVKQYLKRHVDSSGLGIVGAIKII